MSFYAFGFLAFFAFLTILLSASVSGHVYLKHWKSSLDDRLQVAQKADSLNRTAYRPVSDNIGWVGSHFLTTNRAIVCGASETPRGVVKPSGGRFFSDASEAAGMTLPVNAGGKITLVVSGDATKAAGYPHLEGHIQTYLGYCGPSSTACQRFDAAEAYYFKIQEEPNGVHKLRQQLSYSAGGDIWEVPIPQEVPEGSYILRFEIITFGESVEAEGFQDQYYPSCGQIYVESNHRVSPSSFSSLPLLRLPGGYPNGNMVQSAAIPGPSVKTEEIAKGEFRRSANSSHEARKPSHSSLAAKHRLCLPKLVPRCAKSCLHKKLQEIHSLAAECSLFDKACLCATYTFAKAYGNCLKDHCVDDLEIVKALSAFNQSCRAKPQTA